MLIHTLMRSSSLQFTEFAFLPLPYPQFCFISSHRFPLLKQMMAFPDVFLKSVTNHCIQIHFVSKWLVIDILRSASKMSELPDIKQYIITNTNTL